MTRETPDLQSVRAALRAELEARGFEVGSDTLSLRRELYVVGDGDLARAVFEFVPSAREGFSILYQGAWTAGLPPRFAVLPAAEAQSPDLELLDQIRVTTLFFEAAGDGVVFHGLEEGLAALMEGAAVAKP